MADTLEECDRILAAVERAGVQLLVGHSQRYFASTIRARELVQSGSLGEPVFATDTWYKPFGVEGRLPWFLDRATGGGMWLMNGAHMIDRTCWVLDTSVAAVQAWIGSPFHQLPADDACMALLRLRNGQHATIVHAGYRARGVDRCEVEVTCTEGMLLFDSYSNRLSVDKTGAYEAVPVDEVDPFAAELRNLAVAIRGEEPLRVPPRWGRHIVEVLLAAEESSRLGREVSIPPCD
jgi:predicted dehydrogenase